MTIKLLLEVLNLLKIKVDLQLILKNTINNL